jgi:hypothetical protein
MPDTQPTASPEECFTVRAYLRMDAYSCTDPGRARGLVVRVSSTCKRLFPDGITAQWLGDEAEAFYESHHAELVAGRCLDLQLYGVRVHQGELRARIQTCSLAPLSRSWIKHAEKSAAPTSAQPEHHPV